MRVTPALFILVLAGTMPALAADLLELPTRKTGLWEILRKGTGIAPETTRECVDAATDPIMMSIGVLFVHSLGDCPKPDVQQSGDTITIDSACSYSGASGYTGTLTFHTVITGNFDTTYTMTATGTRQPDPDRNGTFEETGKWLGLCTADQKPGDIIGPGPLRQNALEIQKEQQEADRRRPRQQGVPPTIRIPPWLFRSMWPRG